PPAGAPAPASGTSQPGKGLRTSTATFRQVRGRRGRRRPSHDGTYDQRSRTAAIVAARRTSEGVHMSKRLMSLVAVAVALSVVTPAAAAEAQSVTATGS